MTLAVLQNGERVLDVACGTGVLARLAAKAVGPTGKVAAADLNEGMLNMARGKAEQESLPIEYRLCDTAALTPNAIPGAPVDLRGSFRTGFFDVALCQLGLEFFSDRPQALRQIARVLVWIGEAAHVPVIWATQVLEHLIKKGIPLRGEMTDAQWLREPNA